MKVTELPWKVVILGERVYVENDAAFICDLQTGDATAETREQGKKDAAYIVLACNAFPQMKEALEAARAHILSVLHAHLDDDVTAAVLQSIDAALAAAEKGC